MILKKPIKDIYITQPFGVNYVDFYTKLGMKGHNGIDLRARKGCPVLAAHDGEVTWAGADRDGGKSVSLVTRKTGIGYKTIYYHLSKVEVKKGDIVKVGRRIGRAGNTGKYTTGTHLHFGLKRIRDMRTFDHGNGYKGALNPEDYFFPGLDNTPAKDRYGRERQYLAEVKTRFKNKWLHKQLYKRNKINKIYDDEFINAIVYGGWSFDDVINPAMYENWAYMKKDDFINDYSQPFNR